MASTTLIVLCSSTTSRIFLMLFWITFLTSLSDFQIELTAFSFILLNDCSFFFNSSTSDWYVRLRLLIFSSVYFSLASSFEQVVFASSNSLFNFRHSDSLIFKFSKLTLLSSISLWFSIFFCDRTANLSSYKDLIFSSHPFFMIIILFSCNLI